MKFLKILRSLCTGKVLRIVLCSVLCLACLGCTAWALTSVALGRSNSEQAAQTGTHIGIMDRFEKAINNQFSVSMDGLLSIDKVYWLRDEDVIAPEPNQDLFGETTDPADIAQVLKDAEKLLDGQEVLFSPDRNIIPGSTIRYYLDDTILVITWQEHYLNSIYTLSEIKLAHPSQFRRFFAGNQYGYDKQFHTTQMSADVNAVVASSGDFYKHRYDGLVVYNGVVERVDYSYGVESCLIDDQGNMRFSKIGQLMNKAEAQKYVDENNIRFSISFGPILVENGVKRVPGWYMLGDLADPYPRSALCQAGDLHYYIIISNAQPPYNSFHTLYTFADYVAATGCDMAYTLDGGQTATLAMNDQHINPVQYGSQRFISDIFYFATAIPDGGQ